MPKETEYVKSKLKSSIEILQGMVYAIDKGVDFPVLSDLDELAAVRKHIDDIEVILIITKGKP